ncbi:MAG: PAS domain S-box protein [Bacteroidetes bacterium]|nr:PAS domain S-box protein [Bacteroidota bacterium]
MLKPLKILILEDVPLDVELIKRELKKADINFTSRTEYTKDGFIKALDEFSPDVILSDHSMPQFDSIEAFEIFKQKKLSIPFILVTGTVSEEFAVEVLKNGVDDYVLKDNLARLPTAIQKALNQRIIESEKLQAIEKLRKSEEHFRLLIENATDIIIILDSNFYFTFSSPSIERILGYTPNEILGKNISDFIHPNDLDSFTNEFEKILSDTDGTYFITFRFRTKNTRWLYIESTAKAYSESDGGISYIINSRDITDRVKIEEKLKYKIKELDILIYMYSHDLKGPFCSLQGFLYIAKMEVKDENALRFLNLIENTTNKLDNLLMNLVNITMLSRENVNISEVDIGKIVDQAIKNSKPFHKDIEIQFKIDIDLKEKIYSDPKLLLSIFDHLISNAVVFKNLDIIDPYVDIRVSKKHNRLIISVKDNGIGIPTKIQDKVYDIFFRGSHESKGSGLGLYIVKNAVEKLNGHIELQSKLGEGSEFIVELPLKNKQS